MSFRGERNLSAGVLAVELSLSIGPLGASIRGPSAPSSITVAGTALPGDASPKRLLERWGPRTRTAFMDSRTSRPRLGIGEFCEGGMTGTPFGEVPRCFCIWYAENLL